MPIKRFNRLAIVRSLRLFVPFAAMSVAVAVLLFRFESTANLAQIHNYEAASVQVGVNAIQRVLRSITSDLMYLAANEDFLEFLSDESEESHSHLSANWQALSRTKGIYDQIRWLDMTGQERIRVNFNKGAPAGVPTDKLQNKGRRYYFTDAVKLSRGEFFISPFDLNVEGGKVEQPIKPMIRVATPAFDRNGKKRGIILVNYFGDTLLREFDRMMGARNGRAWLLNREGYWLKGPSPDLEWGFMYKRPEASMNHRYPDAWSQILAAEQGQFEGDQGFWTFATVHPLVEGQKTSSGTYEAHAPSQSALEARDYIWKAILMLPSAEYRAGNRQSAITLLIITGFLLVVLFFGCWRLAYAWALRREAEENLRYLNVNLEHKVAEQTKELRKEIDGHLRSESKLRESHEKLRSLLEKMPVAAALINENEDIYFRNSQFNQLFGYTEEAVPTLAEWWPAAYPDEEYRKWIMEKWQGAVERSAREQTEIKPTEARITCKDGQIKDVEISGIVFGKEYLATFIDLTESKKSAKALEAAKFEAEKANQAKSGFLAAMSHDLRTPLNAITGFAEMMQLKIFGPLGDPHYEQYADDIHDSGKLLISLINDVLDLSKIEAGKYDFAEEHLNVSSLVDTSFRQLSGMAEDSSKTLTSDVPPDMPTLLGDERVLTQLLNNLLSNAIKFTPDGGKIDVTAEVNDDNGIVLSVTDTGIGMSDDGVAKALRPFEQADGTQSLRYEGTGLGLHLCLNFMKLFGGTLEIDSEVGTGTTVSLHFPPERTIRPS